MTHSVLEDIPQPFTSSSSSEGEVEEDSNYEECDQGRSKKHGFKSPKFTSTKGKFESHSNNFNSFLPL